MNSQQANHAMINFPADYPN